MNFCPFCGSAAAAWPEYASDYVRGYPLCEHHMRLVLKSSTHYEYDKYRLEYAERWEKISKLVIDFADEEAEKMSATYSNIPALQSDNKSYMFDCKVCDDFIRALGFAIESSPIEKGDPISVSIIDEEVDRIISVRITAIAKDSELGKPVYRCSAEKSAAADGRCINRVDENGKTCNECKRRGSAHVFIGADKMKQLMEVLRK